MILRILFVCTALIALVAVGPTVAAAAPAQYPPGATTTTVPGETTVPETTTPGTTAPETTSPETTTPATAPQTTDGSGALGEDLNQGGGSSGQSGSGLARTGTDLVPFALVGGALLLAGAFALVSSGRLRRPKST